MGIFDGSFLSMLQDPKKLMELAKVGVPIAASMVGTPVAGMAAGALMQGAGAGMEGGSMEDMLKAGLLGGATSAAGAGVGKAIGAAGGAMTGDAAAGAMDLMGPGAGQLPSQMAAGAAQATQAGSEAMPAFIEHIQKLGNYAAQGQELQDMFSPEQDMQILQAQLGGGMGMQQPSPYPDAGFDYQRRRRQGPIY